MDVPEGLRHRIALFRESARVFRVPNELFAENSWIQVMLGQGVLPQDHHPTPRLMNDAELEAFLERIRSEVSRTLARLPEHEPYVRGWCAEAAPG